MILFKTFVKSIHDAILEASQSLMDKNMKLIDDYFETCEDHEHDEDKKTLKPKSVIVEYPYQTEDGIKKVEVHVPLITLVPLSLSQIKKAKFTANFEMEIIDDKLELNFYNKNTRLKRGAKKTRGTIELTFAPHEIPDGLAKLVEGYETILKSQIPN